MTKFSYIVIDKTGKKIEGIEEALSVEELREKLQARDFLVVKILSLSTSESLPESEFRFFRQHHRITSKDIITFCQQLSSLLSGGVSILESLKIISKQCSSRRLQEIIDNIIQDMESGLTLHEAFAKYPRVFSDLWVNLIESGEASGSLAEVLQRLQDYLDKTNEFKQKIITALIYPTIVIVIGIFALFFLTVKIIPTFTELFKSFNIKLPLITQILVFISEISRRYFLPALISLVIFIFIFRYSLSTKKGRKRWERFLLTFGLTQDFSRAIVIERFSSSMATLLESGVPLLYALDITERNIANLVVSEIIFKIKEEVREGKGLSIPMGKSGFFEPMVIQMVRIGEETGSLYSMFKRISKFYQNYIENYIQRFEAIFEPVVLLILAGIIGLMVAGIFFPLFQITQIH